jgi:hypothetical protein
MGVFLVLVAILHLVKSALSISEKSIVPIFAQMGRARQIRGRNLARERRDRSLISP